jgi:hypothetical protein
MYTHLYRITAPHFVAGLTVDGDYGGRIGDAAPIIGWSIGWKLDDFLSYCKRKNWTVEDLGEL